MTDTSTEAEIDALRATRDAIGDHGDLFMRLNGFYRVGPDGPVEPEFGYLDFRDGDLCQHIQLEAACALRDISAERDALRADLARLKKSETDAINEVKRLRAIMSRAHAVMRECGWQLAIAAEPQGDGILEAACTEIEAEFAEVLKGGANG